MVGAPDVVQPWMPRAARDSAAWLCHVSIVGGARRRGWAAAGVSVFSDGPLARRDPEGVGERDAAAVGVEQRRAGAVLAAFAGDRPADDDVVAAGLHRAFEAGGHRREHGEGAGRDAREARGTVERGPDEARVDGAVAREVL